MFGYYCYQNIIENWVPRERIEQVKELYNEARNSDDIAACEFISEILQNQVKEVGCFRKISFKIKNANIVSSNIEHLDYTINNISI